MIRLTCTNCRAMLEVDEGFAGGVCRCNHCATIQTVPKAGETQTRGKTIFKKTGSAGSELDRLGDTVSGSGLAGSGLGYANPRNAKKTSPLILIIAISGGLGLLLLIFGGLMWTQQPQTVPVLVSTTPGLSAVPPATPKNVIPTSPSFGTIDLSRSTRVVYLLDRGDATGEYFDQARAAVFNSAQSLGPTKSFQLVFWAQGDNVAVFPAASATATTANIESARIAAMEITAGRSTDARGGLAKAMAAGPSDVVLITGKGWLLDEDFATTLLAAKGTTPIRIHTVSLGSESPPLTTIARTTGATAISLDADALRTLAGP